MVTRDVTSIIVDSALFRLKIRPGQLRTGHTLFAQRDSVITKF